MINVKKWMKEFGIHEKSYQQEAMRWAITKENGLICFTINEAIYENQGFKTKLEELKNNNKIEEIEFFKSNYLASKDVNAWLGLYKVL